MASFDSTKGHRGKKERGPRMKARVADRPIGPQDCGREYHDGNEDSWRKKEGKAPDEGPRVAENPAGSDADRKPEIEKRKDAGPWLKRRHQSGRACKEMGNADGCSRVSLFYFLPSFLIFWIKPRHKE